MALESKVKVTFTEILSTWAEFILGGVVRNSYIMKHRGQDLSVNVTLTFDSKVISVNLNHFAKYEHPPSKNER